VPEQGIPLEVSGKIEPFKKSRKQMQKIKVRSFSLTTSKDGICIQIDARATI
jgi:hypothetical protein